jgi:hypothetical protein
MGLFGDREKGSVVGPHQRLQRRVLADDISEGAVEGGEHHGQLVPTAPFFRDRECRIGNRIGDIAYSFPASYIYDVLLSSSVGLGSCKSCWRARSRA